MECLRRNVPMGEKSAFTFTFFYFSIKVIQEYLINKDKPVKLNASQRPNLLSFQVQKRTLGFAS